MAPARDVVLIVVAVSVIVLFAFLMMTGSNSQPGCDSKLAQCYETLSIATKPTPRPRRYAFIDCGANRADTFALFLQEETPKVSSLLKKGFKYPKPDDKEYADFEIFLIEGNPKFTVDLENAVKTHPNVKVNIFPRSVCYTHDNKITFAVRNDDKHDDASSSITHHKIRGQNKTDTITVQSIDMAKFLTDRFVLDDFVILKLDIEHAELDVCRHILARGAHLVIDHLLVEVHAGNRDKPMWHAVEEIIKLSGVNMPPYDTPT
jgi:FkbM family methyltransferase